MGVYIPTEEELEAGRSSEDFVLLPADLYVVEVVRRENKKQGITEPDTVSQPNPYNKTEEHPGGVPRPVLFVSMKPISFANGDELVDDAGDPIPPDANPLFFAFLDTTKVGLKPQPAAFRKFITAANGLSAKESVNIESWDELVGKRLIVAVEHTDKGKHKVTDYQPIRSRRRAAAARTEVKTDVTVTDDAEAIAAKAKEAFGDDAPSF